MQHVLFILLHLLSNLVKLLRRGGAKCLLAENTIWTLLASFPATRHTKRDTMPKEEIEARCQRASSNEHEVLLVGLSLCHFQNPKHENQRAAGKASSASLEPAGRSFTA